MCLEMSYNIQDHGLSMEKFFYAMNILHDNADVMFQTNRI